MTKASITDLNRPLSKMDIFYTGSISSLVARDKLLNNSQKLASSTAVKTNLGDISLETTSKSLLYLSNPVLTLNDNHKLSSSKWKQNIAAVIIFCFILNL